MELGITIPLRRFLKRPPPPRGREEDRRLCWDLHVIPLHGRASLLAVHCHSRYTFVLFDPAQAAWAAPAEMFADGLGESLGCAGLPEAVVAPHVAAARQALLTATHGRREVAFLNRAWEDVARFDALIDRETVAQPLLDRAVNALPCRSAGWEGKAPALSRIAISLGGPPRPPL